MSRTNPEPLNEDTRRPGFSELVKRLREQHPKKPLVEIRAMAKEAWSIPLPSGARVRRLVK